MNQKFDQGFAWHWKADEDDLGWMLWPMTLSAADVLLSPYLHQLKECPGLAVDGRLRQPCQSTQPLPAQTGSAQTGERS